MHGGAKNKEKEKEIYSHHTVLNLRKFTLTLFRQIFREINTLTIEITK